MVDMSNNIQESDWKTLRKIKDRLLNEYCDNILEAVESTTKNRKGKEHETYLDVWNILEEKDDEIAYMFNDLKRSNAIMKIFHMVQFGAMTLNELEQFSHETRERVKNLLEIYQD